MAKVDPNAEEHVLFYDATGDALDVIQLVELLESGGNPFILVYRVGKVSYNIGEFIEQTYVEISGQPIGADLYDYLHSSTPCDEYMFDPEYMAGLGVFF